MEHRSSYMVLELSLNKLAARVALAILAIGLCAALTLVVFYQFVIGTLADERLLVTRNLLEIPLQRFPHSSRLNSRFARNEVVESGRDLARAVLHAQRAINLSPYDYRLRLTLSSAKEASGDRAAAEEAMRKAHALAPTNGDVCWRMANLLVRHSKLEESLDHFRAAIAYDGELLGTTLDLVWRASGGNVDALAYVSGDDPKVKLKLARFLLQQSRVTEAVAVLGGVDRSERLASPDSPAFLNSLMAAGQFDVARGLWSSLVGVDAAGALRPEGLIWNGGFESDILKDFSQFDWSFAPSEYARLNIDATTSRSGSRSLRIIFGGRDTTNLANAIKQLVVVQPGASYRIECFVKTSDLVTTEGPTIVVTGFGSGELIAASDPVAAGSSDWRLLSVVFRAPPSKSGNSSAVHVSIQRKPKYAYDEPTKGSVWFDEFTMRMLVSSQ